MCSTHYTAPTFSNVEGVWLTQEHNRITTTGLLCGIAMELHDRPWPLQPVCQAVECIYTVRVRLYRGLPCQ